jgi:hypothetical protein
MTLRRASALLLVTAAGLVAACGSTKTAIPVVLDQPTGLAAFMGVTAKNAGVHPYLAVANGARDDLTLLDTLDDKPVLAPVLLRSLAVPTGPRPAQVVSGALHDVDGGGQPVQKADLVAVLLEGSPIVQVVRTWSDDNQVVDALEVDLQGVAPGSDALYAVTAPVPDATGAAVPGKVRLVLALTGRRLAVVEFDRDPGDGEGLVRAGPPVIQELDFQPLHLAVAKDPRFVYAATVDDLPAGSGRHGVVELDASGAPGGWAVDLLDARGPTRLVAALDVAERDFSATSTDVDIPEGAPFVPRVYAMLDHVGCGASFEIECGIVTLDPAPGVRGIVPDPLGELAYQPPIRIPAEPIAFAPAGVPAKLIDTWTPERMRVQTGLGIRETSGVLGLAAADGRVYPVDLGRRTLLNDKTMLRDIPNSTAQTRTRASQIGRLLPLDPVDPDLEAQIIACDRTQPDVPCAPTRDLTASASSVLVTPGYTFNEQFDVVWQGILPNLGGFGTGMATPNVPHGVKAMTADQGGKLRVALQVPSTLGYTEVVRVFDPALGVRPGDIVQIATFNEVPACEVPEIPPDQVDPTPNTNEQNIDAHDFTIAAVLPPDPVDYPGGALLVDDDSSACVAALRAGRTPRVTIRAAGWVMRGSDVGYAGRPVVTSAPGEVDVRVHVELRYSDQTAPDKACPLVPWPDHPELVSCDDACRLRCEALKLARLSRRWYTMSDQCGTDLGCRQRWGAPQGTNFDDPFPNLKGPVVEFDFTLRTLDAKGKEKPTDAVERDLGLSVSLASGHEPTTRYPGAYVVFPADVAAFDRSPWNASQSYRFYVAYTGDQVFDFSPGEPVNLPVLIR